LELKRPASKLDGDRSRRRTYFKRVFICSLLRKDGSHSVCAALRKALGAPAPSPASFCAILWPFGVRYEQGPPARAPAVQEADVDDLNSPLGLPAEAPAAHLGWYSRGYVPHCDGDGLIQHVVFGLADALPPSARPPSSFHGDRLLDAGYGECLLRNERCAEIVQGALLRDDGERYRLIAWCVMPNHVHVVMQQVEGARLADAIQAIKSAAAHQINRELGRKGRLWRREYFDRFMRDDDHLATTISYVGENPSKAGFVTHPAQWKWSSAPYRLESAGEGAGGPRT
jgi:putative transposase